MLALTQIINTDYSHILQTESVINNIQRTIIFIWVRWPNCRGVGLFVHLYVPVY